MSDPNRPRVRLDRWLWAARFYKTRAQSTTGIKGGKVDLNGTRAKPSQKVGAGDRVQVRKGPFHFAVLVTAVAERRGNAERARELYQEEEASLREREETRQRLAAEARAMPRHWTGRGRPTKKQRRALMAFQERIRAPEDLWSEDDADELSEDFDDVDHLAGGVPDDRDGDDRDGDDRDGDDRDDDDDSSRG